MSIAQRNPWLVLSWAPYSRMSSTFASEVGAPLVCIHYLRFQYPWHAPLKYPLQAARTLQVLFRQRPRAVHVQNPPFVSGLVVALYCRLTGARFALHYHSAAFGRMWDWALPVQKWLARKATVNIVTNQHWAGIVAGWGGQTLVMVDPFLELPRGEPYPLKPGFNVVFISTFAEDEPTDAVLEAAASLPDVHFTITGDRRRKPANFFDSAPANVAFPGFLDPNREYPGLLRAADAVLVLTTRDHTLQLGGCEAAALGKPLITSDWPYLHEVFSRGTVYVDNTAEGIAAGVRAVQDNLPWYQQEIGLLRREKQLEWNVRLERLRKMMEEA